MEGAQNKQSKMQMFYASVKKTTFDIMLELLKDKKTGKWYSCLLMLILMLQVIGLLFDKDNNLGWQDGFALNAMNQISYFFRILPMIENASSEVFYWVLYSLAIGVVAIIVGLIIYTKICLYRKKFYMMWPVNILKEIILLLFWVLFQPFYESLVNIFTCSNGHHYIIQSMECYGGMHIVTIILAILFAIILIILCVLIALFYNETQQSQEDALAKMPSTFEMEILVYRSAIVIFNSFCYNVICNWILVIFFLLSSIILCYQYYKAIPYYNSFVSVFWGSLVFCYMWFSLNALLMMFIDLDGQIIIIAIGIPLLAIMVKFLRDKRIELLFSTNIEKLKVDTDALIQIHSIQLLAKGGVSHEDEVVLIGLINVHLLECSNAECMCKPDSELFDVSTDKFSDHQSMCHKDRIFLNHYIKRLYEESVSKFVNSPSLHIAFAHYLLDTIKNVHASLVELNLAEKKKPSFQQQFTIFRSKYIIENFIRGESTQNKDLFNQLTNVIEFEQLFGECQKTIEKVCNFQVDFWTQLTNNMPDMNILNDLGMKMYYASQEADQQWQKLCKINSNYPKALNMYGLFLIEIKNNRQVGNDLLEKAKSNNNFKKSLEEVTKSSDVLFDDSTAVLHISGNKETAGRILKTNRGLTSIFSYSKSEMIGHAVNILMPSIFAKKHNDFMERFFKTGRQKMFNKERNLFALNRSGFCMHVKILIKQMPTLSEGVQYVGMIRKIHEDYDYVISDMRGVIDSFSQNLSSALNIPPALFKDAEINIQILAPDLIDAFAFKGPKSPLQKFKDPGGSALTFIVPRNIIESTMGDNINKKTKETKQVGKKQQIMPAAQAKKNPIFKGFNRMLNKRSDKKVEKITAEKLKKTPEYRNPHIDPKKVKCEIKDLMFSLKHNEKDENDAVRIRIFRVSGCSSKNMGSNYSDSNEVEGFYENVATHSMESFEVREDTKSVDSVPPVKEEKEKPKAKENESEDDKELMMEVENTEENKEESKNSKKDKDKEKDESPNDRKLTEERLETQPAQAPLFASKLKQEEKKEKPLRQPTPKKEAPPKSPDSAQNKEEKQKIAKSKEQTHSSKEEGAVAGESESHSSNDSKKKDEGKKEGTEKSSTDFDANDFDESNVLNEDSKAKEEKKDSIKTDSNSDSKKGEAKKDDKKDEKKKEEQKEDKKKEEPKKDNDKSSEKGDKLKPQTSDVSAKNITGSSQFAKAERDEEDKKDTDVAPETKKDTKKQRVRSKKYPTKIITNPIYEIGQQDLENLPEYVEDEKEKQIKKALRAAERKKKKEEKKAKEMEDKSKDESDKEKGKEKEGATSDEEKKKEKKKKKKDKEKKNETGKENEEEKKTEEDKKEDDSSSDNNEAQEVQSSITSGSTGSTVRSYYSLRAAIDEKFIPKSIRNLKMSVNVIIVVLLALSVVYYVIQIQLYDNINSNIKNLQYSEKRLSYLIDINLQILTLRILPNNSNTSRCLGNINTNDINGTNYAIEQRAKTRLKDSATLLKEAQTDLSLKTSSLSADSLANINPSNVVLYYLKTAGMPDSYNYTIWQAIMEIVVSAYRITQLDVGSISSAAIAINNAAYGYNINKTADPTVYFVTKNSLNNVMLALRNSSKAIITETENIRQYNNKIFLILLIVAVACIVLSLSILLPVISMVKSSNAEVLELFLKLHKKNVEEEQTKCRKHLGSLQSNDQEIGDAEEKEKDAEEEKDKNESARKTIGYNKNKGKKSKSKFKKLASNLGLIFFKFIFLILIMGGYFLLIYFFASSFLSQVSSLTTELNMLISRFPTYSYLLMIQKESIFTNYTSTFEGNDGLSFVFNYHNTLYGQEELMFDNFSANQNYHTEKYNTDFNSLINSNLCTYLPGIKDNNGSITVCQSFDQGILQKGLYSAVIKYWDYLRTLNHDFNDTSKNTAAKMNTAIVNFLSQDGLATDETMQQDYFNTTLSYLVARLQEDIDSFFNNENNRNKILFIVYIIYAIGFYLIIWLPFVWALQRELWRTKSIMSVLPPEYIMSIPDIKTFILNNSSTVFLSRSGH